MVASNTASLVCPAVHSYVAIILSVTLILIFGEILPQAVCTGPNRLAIGAGSYYLVMALQLIIYPLAWGIGKVLDRVLGTEEQRDSVFLYLPREQLGLRSSDSSMALVELHGAVEAEMTCSGPGGVNGAVTRRHGNSGGGTARSSRGKPSSQDISEMDTMPIMQDMASDYS